MLMAQLTVEFPWGLLLVTDQASTELIPPDASPDPVIAVRTSLVMRVEHPDDGAVAVRLWSGRHDVAGSPIFVGELAIDSGILKISDVLGQNAVLTAVPVGTHGIAIFADDARGATQVDLVVE